MGRGPLQVLWVTGSMAVGIWAGRTLSQMLFWDEELKYKVWEQTEIVFWNTNGKPAHLEAKVEFESVVNPGQIFRSYIPDRGISSLEDTFDKYDI